MGGCRAIVAATAAFMLVGCASETEPSGDTAPPATTTLAPTSGSALPTAPPASRSTSPEIPEPTPATITTAASEFGDVLFDDSGQAIYLFDLEESATPVCYDECAVEWPPVLTEAAPVAANGAEADLLGTTPRADGSLQVTYGGHPLYFYAHEGKNEVRCHNFAGFGGVWFAISPGGDPAPY